MISRRCFLGTVAAPLLAQTPGRVKSGLNGMLRDEDHAREFLKRHQDKLMFGSDCTDTNPHGPDCLGSQILAAIRRLAPDEAAKRKILCDNASRLMKIPA